MLQDQILKKIKKFFNFLEKPNCIDEFVDYKNIQESNKVREIISSIISLEKDTEHEFDIFMELSILLKNINSNEKYSEIISVFNTIAGKLKEEWTKNSYIYEEVPDSPNTACSIVWTILNNNKDGVTSIEWTMKDFIGKDITQSFEAYHMDSDTWELLQLYIEDSKGNDEGYTYKCVLEPEISEIEYPYCDCEYVSSTDTVQGNYINSNCDTWGTEYGSKAKGVYAFYISDLDKFAIVYESYWVY